MHGMWRGTYFAVVVEVGVEADAVSPCGLQVDQGGGVGIVLREINVKLKAAVGIGSISWTCDQNLQTAEAAPRRLSARFTHTHTHETPHTLPTRGEGPVSMATL